jgi:CheY-like chemotaxis protein
MPAPTNFGARPILVVDDEPVIRSVLSQVLSGDGYPVTAAHDVASAIAALEGSPFAAILTDLKMPGRTGLALVDEVERRSLPTPVILMSASLGELDGSDPRVARLAGRVAKPFELEELRRLISAAIGIGQ